MHNILAANVEDFILNNGHVNSHYSTFLVKRAYQNMEYGYKKYFQNTYHWKHQTIESLWWKVYYKLIETSNPSNKTRIGNFFHQSWYTNDKGQKSYPFRASTCNQCHQ